MNFYLKNKVLIENFTPEVLSYCNDTLTFDNPDFLKKESMGKFTGKTLRKIVLYERNGNNLLLPFGVWKDVYSRFKNLFASSKAIFELLRKRSFGSNINLYPYQQRAVESVLRVKNGILVAPCGSGKTQMGLEIVSRIGGKTLWITHTIDLLNQSMERAKACFGLPLSEYGTITSGKVNIGNTITFATVQTLSNIDLSQFYSSWDCIIVDECHKCVGSPTQMMMFYKVLSKLAARYKIGLTATPYRADGLDKCMFALLGDIVYEVPKEAVKDTTCTVKVKFVETGFMPDLDVILAGDGTLVYSSLIDNIIKDEQRNKKIAKELDGLDGATIVLSDRVEHLFKLYDKLADNSLAVVLSGQKQSKTEKENRKRVLADLNSGKLRYVFATYKLAKEGLDVPNLRYVVFATPQKDRTTVTQAAGRVGRKAEGKEFGTVVDFVDDFGMLRGYQRRRKTIYKKLGFIY